MAIGTCAPISTTGRSMGGSADSECRIDSIAQSWAVLSGAAAAGKGGAGDGRAGVAS